MQTYEPAMRQEARRLIAEHGELVEVCCVSGPPDYRIELAFADGYEKIITRHSGRIDITMMKFGYMGTGTRCFHAFLDEAGFKDISLEQLAEMEGPQVLRKGEEPKEAMVEEEPKAKEPARPPGGEPELPLWTDVSRDPSLVNPLILEQLQKSMCFMVRDETGPVAALIIRASPDEFRGSLTAETPMSLYIHHYKAPPCSLYGIYPIVWDDPKEPFFKETWMVGAGRVTGPPDPLSEGELSRLEALLSQEYTYFLIVDPSNRLVAARRVEYSRETQERFLGLLPKARAAQSVTISNVELISALQEYMNRVSLEEVRAAAKRLSVAEVEPEEETTSEHANLAPGSTVPKSGKYRCAFCGEGGMADFFATMLKGTGAFTGQLEGLGKQESVRFFEAGKEFTECPNCGPATGWTLIEEGPSGVQPSQPRHDEAVSESGACDICTRKVSSPDGYLLTTTEVVSTPKYWQHYYQHHEDEFASMGVSSYEEFCRNPLVRASCGEMLAKQETPWMVCENCISMFDVDWERSRGYAKQWWQSRRTFQPPGTGPAPLSAINMGEGSVIFPKAEGVERPAAVPTIRRLFVRITAFLGMLSLAGFLFTAAATVHDYVKGLEFERIPFQTQVVITLALLAAFLLFAGLSVFLTKRRKMGLLFWSGLLGLGVIGTGYVMAYVWEGGLLRTALPSVPPTATPIPKFVTFEGDIFSFEYPSNWEVITEKEIDVLLDTSLKGLSPGGYDYIDGVYIGGVNGCRGCAHIVVVSLKDPNLTGTLADEQYEQVKASYENTMGPRLISIERTEVSGMPGVEVVNLGRSGDTKLRGVIIIPPEPGIAYSLNCLSHKDSFDEFEAIFSRAIESLRIEGVAPLTTTPSPAPQVITYTVQAGDTLGEIAAEFGVTVEEIVEANDIEDPSLINAGQVLVIPQP